MDFSDHVFTTMFEALSNALAAIVGKYAAVIGIVSPALRIGIVIYISLLGYAIMRGAVQYPFREYAYRGCQLAFLYFAVTSLYGTQIGMFALGGLPSQFASALGGSDVGGLGGFYDKLAGTGFETANTMRKIAADYQQTQGTLPDIGYAVFSGFLVVMVIIATLLCAAIGFVISAFGLFALALLSVVGPLFVAALLFEPTRGYFFAWLGACINYLMLIVFALVLTLFLTKTGDAIIATISENDEIGMAAIKALAFYALGFFFFLQIPMLAASLGGGGPALANQFASAIAAAGGFVAGRGATGAQATSRAIERGFARGIARMRTSGSVKRENYDASAGFRARYGHDVFLFNPTDREGRTARYNPLAYINRGDPDDVIIELQKIATMLFVAPERGEAFWANGARTGFAGVGAWLAETSDEPLTMGAIYRHLTEGDARSFFKKELANPKLSLSTGCRTALTDFAGGSDNSFADIKKTITNVLGLWLNPLVDAATSASDFDLRDLRKRPISIYLGVSPDELDRIAPLYNLLFQQLIDLNVRELPDETTPVPVLVILDEFARLGRASVLASAFSYVAGYGIRLLPVIQSRSQLRGVYGEHLADEIVANCGVEVAFTPKELRVANELSDRIGYVGQESVTRSLTINGLLANRSKSISEQRRALLLPQELMQFPTDRLILLRGGIPPIIGTKIFYYKSRFFKNRAFPPPVVSALEKQTLVALAPTPFRDMTDEEAEGNPAYPLTPDDIRTEDYPSFCADLLTLDRHGNASIIIEEGDENG